MEDRSDPSIFIRMDKNLGSREGRESFRLTVVIDVTVGDENSFDRAEAEPDGFEPLCQGLEGSLGLDACIDQCPRRVINQKDVRRFEWERYGKLDLINLLRDLLDQRYLLSPLFSPAYQNSIPFPSPCQFFEFPV